jgi:DNA polymerase-3 subunit epsilon
MDRGRCVFLDVETTGLDPDAGHRIVEIGCLEMVNYIATSNHYHQYINPERDVPQEVVDIHGLTYEFLSDKPIFCDIAVSFLDFIKDDILIIHNAKFDIKFLNAELSMLGLPLIKKDRVIDSLQVAKKKFPGAAANLDALCKRFGVNTKSRNKHGALIDTKLLFEVYINLVNQARPKFAFAKNRTDKSGESGSTSSRPREIREIRNFECSEDELAEHEKFVSSAIREPIWNL